MKISLDHNNELYQKLTFSLLGVQENGKDPLSMKRKVYSCKQNKNTKNPVCQIRWRGAYAQKCFNILLFCFACQTAHEQNMDKTRGIPETLFSQENKLYLEKISRPPPLFSFRESWIRPSIYHKYQNTTIRNR